MEQNRTSQIMYMRKIVEAQSRGRLGERVPSNCCESTTKAE